MQCPSLLLFFFFNDTATTEIYTLSLHDALPILARRSELFAFNTALVRLTPWLRAARAARSARLPDVEQRSEEHTSELQSPDHLVCRLLLEKKKKNNK